MHWNRLAVLAPLALAVVSIAAQSPDKPAASNSGKPLRVAVLPVVNRTAEVDAAKIMGDVLSERLKDVDRSKATFAMPGDVERILNSQDALDRAYRITDRWVKNGSLDSTAVAGLDSILVADAVLCIKIGEWETKRYHNIGEGQSNTTIGLHFTLFSIRDKKQIWSKDIREQRLAPELDLTNGTVGYDETGRTQTPNVNEPPRVQEVASDLVRDAFRKFPIK